MLIASLTISSVLAYSPIILGINILVTSLVLASLYALTLRAWYSFLIFLIYTGGILVIFAYFTAISPNQHINFSNIGYSISITIITLNILIWRYPSIAIRSGFQTTSLYQTGYAAILILIVIFLLVTILIIVKVASMSKGPLRPFIYV